MGLFVDGLQLKYVQLSLTAGRVILRDFKTVSLGAKLEEKTVVPKDDDMLAVARDESTFGAMPHSEEASTESAAGEVTTNATVLVGLLSAIPPKEYTLSFALSEPAIRYHEFDTDFGLSGVKLKKRIAQELAAVGTESPTMDSLGIIKTASGKLLSIVRQNGLQLYDLLTEIRPFLNGRIPNVKVIHSADVALMEIVRSSYEFQEDQVTVVVYVGNDFSRVIFMLGNNYLHFAPIISEGHTSGSIGNTVSSRIRLEQENIALTRIDRILLAGESHKVNLLDSIAPEFPRAQIEYLTVKDIDVSQNGGTGDQVISEYAIPLSIAWRALQPKLKGVYDIDLVPFSIIEIQKVFGLAWHGWIAAALIILSIVYFYTSIVPKEAEIRMARELLSQNQSALTELETYKARKDAVEADIAKYENAMRVYNSIAKGSDRWSRILLFLANTVQNLNSIWIHSIRSVEGNPSAFELSGKAFQRSRVSKLVNTFEKASLLQVKTVTVRNRELFEFDILVEKVDKEDAPYIPLKGSKR